MESSSHGILKDIMIFQKTRTTNLADVRSLNMWGYELEDVSIISKLVNAETISLPINRITSLSAFQNLPNLNNLLLRQNLISDFNEICHLSYLPNLECLTLLDNPIASLPNYRETVIKMLPQLKKLDDVNVNLIHSNLSSIQNSNGLSKSYHMKQQFHLLSGMKSCDSSKNKTLNQNKNFNQENQFNHDNMYRSEVGEKKMRQSLNMKMILQKRKENQERKIDKKNDSHFLTAVLSLIPELSVDSLQIVLDAINERCM
ncbi:Leucine Rich Repeat family protein [Tritrichomonas foetus]|uniref:Leucine Rich Repeat family protein n=1 Tax=Tritrichomonas foetus TaxID=1144522 RepID=A0A1J4KNL2_9EUKA|nr:Leucine Rich Repeat family protein [Tritrichomonas foetus]|eukprot:OHT12835.1 Leucine Rich Repeat family protein [Tritrichomonas foetus]